MNIVALLEGLVNSLVEAEERFLKDHLLRHLLPDFLVKCFQVLINIYQKAIGEKADTPLPEMIREQL